MKKPVQKIAFLATILAVLVITFTVGMIAYGNRQVDIETVTVKINYYYFDEEKPGNKGTRPYPAFEAYMPKNAEPMVRRCPTVRGFTAQDVHQQAVVNVTITFEESYEVDVFYVPDQVDYSIRLMLQNLEGTDYDLVSVLRDKGDTGTIPKEFDDTYVFPEDYDGDPTLRGKTLASAVYGYTLMYHQPDVIAADGSTEFECYYDRNYYHVDFVLGDGGQGTAPIYAPFEYPLSAEKPTRAGFVFKGWAIQKEDPDYVYTEADVVTLPRTITQDITYVAVWQRPEPIRYHVVYRNADLPTASGDTKYSYWGKRTLMIDPSESLSLSLDDIIARYKDKYDELDEVNESTGKNELIDFPYFAFDEAMTKAKNKDVITVNGDGSTVITLYYARRNYELKFVYARQPLGERDYVNTDNAALDNSEGYILLNLKHSLALTDQAGSHSNATGLKLGTPNENAVRWFFEPVPNKTDRFYVYCLKNNGTRQYLTIANNAASLGTQKTEIIVDRKAHNNGYWTLSVPYNSEKNIYLNDKKDAGKIVAGSMYHPTDEANSGNVSSQWVITVSVEKQDRPGAIEITNSTSNGHDPGTPGSSYNVWWGVKVKDLPTVVLPSSDYFSPGVTICTKTETKVFYDIPYIYYYISLTAPYDADIESAWPADVFTSCCYRLADNGEYRFGSWGTQENSLYRIKYKSSDHSNIVGPYPTMASELTCKDQADSPVAQTLYAWWGDMSTPSSGSYAAISDHRLNIYLENIDDDNYTLFDPPDGRYTFQCAHNSNTTIYPFAYKGFLVWPQEDVGVLSRTHREGTDGIFYTTFHYTRKRSALLLENYNSNYKTYTSVKYGASIKSLEPAAPPCPEGLNSRYYTFHGWYTSNLFLPAEKVDWDTFTMPDHDEVLYAYWQPNTYTINYYNDESAYQNNQPFIYSGVHSYGSYLPADELSYVDEQLNAPSYTLSDGTIERAVKVGWYYYDEAGELHAFDPDTMTVIGHLDLFMKWSTTVPAFYRVHYYLEGTTRKVGSDTNGFSFVGLTKTFQAKVEKQLDPDYRTGYFPYVKSTSLLLKSDMTQNEAIFYYAHLGEVPYRVRYVELNEDGTEGEVLHPDKLVLDNQKAVVTEKHIPIEDYVPTAYYLTHIITVPDAEKLDADGVSADNVLTFYYRHDDANLPYRVQYMVEDEKGVEEKTLTINGEEHTYTFKTVNFIDGIGFRGENETVEVTEYDGYEFIGWDEIIYFGDREEESSMPSDFKPCFEAEKPETLQFCLDCSHQDIFSKEVHLHYIKKTYPVKVSYSIASDNPSEITHWYNVMRQKYPDLQPELSTAVTQDGVCKTLYRIEEHLKFGDSYTATAEELDRYRLSGSNEQTIVVANDEVFAKNKISFIYTNIDQIMFYYKAIIPNGAETMEASTELGLLNINEECVVQGELPQIPVTALLYPNERVELTDAVSVPPYRFVGWFEDRECTIPVAEQHPAFLSDGGLTILPTITPTVDHTFYAKYDCLYGDLTVTTEDCLTEHDVNRSQCFIYRIQGTDTANQWVNLRIVIQGNGSQCIKRLPVGHYTVTQTNWSWRYTSDQSDNKTTVLVLEEPPAEAIFHQSMTNPKWLDGNALAP